MTAVEVKAQAVQDGATLEMELDATVVKFWRPSLEHADWYEYACARSVWGVWWIERWKTCEKLPSEQATPISREEAP